MELTAADLEETEAAMERRTYVDADGCIVDAETGEVIGHERDGQREPFRVDSDASAEWTLELRSGFEGRIAGLEARKRAMVAQMDKLIQAESRKLAWWDFRFAQQVEDFARANLRGKSKTWRCAWGSVAFRATKGASTIVDENEALEFVATWAAGLIQRKEWVTVTAIKEAARRAANMCGEKVDTPFLKSTEAGENVTISTGIDIKETS